MDSPNRSNGRRRVEIKDSDRVNNNYIYLQTGIADEEQVIRAFTETFIRHTVATRFKVSLVKKGGKYCGYAYIWVENEDVFAKLTGVGTDGRRKVKIIKDPCWKIPSIPYEDAKKKMESQFSPDMTDWSDIVAMEDELADLQESYEPRMLEVPEDPVYKLPNYEYNPEQEQHISDTYDEQSLPKYGTFLIGKANIPKDKILLQQNVLFCNRVPLWITLDHLKKLFTPYATDSTTLHKKRVNKNFVTDTYPFIAINAPARKRNYRGGSRNNPSQKFNIAYITFDETKIDGRMALYVCRKMIVVDPSNRKRLATLIFSHPRKTSN